MSEWLARRGIRRFEPLLGRRRPPFARDEEPESAIVAVEPGVRGRRALGRRAIFHRLVDLRDRSHGCSFSGCRAGGPPYDRTWRLGLRQLWRCRAACNLLVLEPLLAVIDEALSFRSRVHLHAFCS